MIKFLTAATSHQLLLVGGGWPWRWWWQPWVDGGRLGPGSLAADCRLQQPPLQHCRRPPADLEPLQLHRPSLQGSKGLHFPRMILGTLLGIHLSDV